MKKAVIFGVSGQDGPFLARFLLEKGYRVTGTSRRRSAEDFPNLVQLGIRDRVEMVCVSMEQPDQVRAVLEKHTPDEVYNLSGQSSVARSFEKPGETFESIATASLNLLEAVQDLSLPAKIFNAGSGDCFGSPVGGIARETTPFDPKSPYGTARVTAFRHIDTFRHARSMFACTGILFNHESMLRPEQFVTRKIVKTACAIARGACHELRLGDTSVIRDWGWAPEYVDAMWRMLQQDTPEDYIIATGTSIRLTDFVAAAFQYLDLDWQRYVKTDPKFVRPADIPAMYADPSKAEQVLGWKAQTAGTKVAQMMVAAELENNTHALTGTTKYESC